MKKFSIINQTVLDYSILFCMNVKVLTAMGTKMPSTYITLTLGILEELSFQKVKESFDEQFSLYIKQNWKRYLDGCFFIWNRHFGFDQKKIKNILNDLDINLKFRKQCIILLFKRNSITTLLL